MSKESLKKQIRYKKLITAINKYWYIIVLSVVTTLALAYFINRYKVLKYRVSSTLYVKNLQPSLSDPANLLFSKGLPYSNMASTIDQSFMIRSSPMIASTIEAIQALNFSISYYEDRLFNQVELYNQSPVKMVVDPKSINIPFDDELYLTLLNTNQYSIELNGKASTPQLWSESRPGRLPVYHQPDLSGQDRQG